MIDFERLDNKKFAYSCLASLNEKNCLNMIALNSNLVLIGVFSSVVMLVLQRKK
ncbi:hypothetical protein JOD43_003720 [Pullulanibacillus pueri]|uniref:Uncharacterized protein n=1 Tax=Pullulanibacillus pueri TaxID=1437324 RepID=A0A8J3EN57_9BACL|nr:hypothetical protein [Pullulanibacillus pueri]GGH86875.1 hypothetical protein GCM10007096_35590 [Pullulanibacillus pueri]